MNKFWVVWQPETGLPRVKHHSREAAEQEAERLAEVTPSKAFFVMEAMTASRKVSVVTHELNEAFHHF